MFNRIYNCKNPHQGHIKKVLCVCSAGLLRSPTAAVVLAQEPYNYNTRAAGLDTDHALIPVDEVLLRWADEVVCMTKTQQENLTDMVSKLKNHTSTKIICLDIKDSYAYRSPELVDLIKTRYNMLNKE